MTATRRTLFMALLAVVSFAAGISTISGQSPIPVQRGRGAGDPAAPGWRGGGPPAAASLPATPVPVPLPSVSAEITGPGAMFESLMAFAAGDGMAHFDYVAQEYFVAGTANGQPYRTRIVIRRPAAVGRFSGLVLAESMHPSGNAWMFHFTHTYTMSAGHIGLDILTSTHAPFVEFNPQRYADLQVAPGQASEILAQVGALIRSSQRDNPLADLPLRKVILAGSSASAGVLINYLPAHLVLRRPGMQPIYDGLNRPRLSCSGVIRVTALAISTRTGGTRDSRSALVASRSISRSSVSPAWCSSAASSSGAARPRRVRSWRNTCRGTCCRPTTSAEAMDWTTTTRSMRGTSCGSTGPGCHWFLRPGGQLHGEGVAARSVTVFGLLAVGTVMGGLSTELLPLRLDPGLQ